MKTKSTGGGNTITGLNFERERNILEVIKKAKDYSLRGNVIYFCGKEVARSYHKQMIMLFLLDVSIILIICHYKDLVFQ